MNRLAIVVAAVAGCHPSPSPRPAALHAELVYAVTQGYGVQPAGEDKGVAYAFLKIDAPAATKIGLTELRLERDGHACAHSTKPLELALIDAVTRQTASAALTLDALAKGTPFDGTLAAGSTFVRVKVEIDHTCGGAATLPTLAIDLDDGEKLSFAIDESMPT